MANAVTLACTESVRQPSAICAKLGIPASFRLPRFPLCPFLPPCPCIKKTIPDARSRKASNKREKIRTSKIKHYGNQTHRQKGKCKLQGLYIRINLVVEQRKHPQVLLRYASVFRPHPKGRNKLRHHRLLFKRQRAVFRKEVHAILTGKTGLAGAFRQEHQHHSIFGTAGWSADLVCMDLSTKL